MYRINDAGMSFMLGVVMLLVKCLLAPTIGISAYCYIWSYYGFQNLVPLDSWCHYVGVLLAADCGYYWFHRTAHQYHISWAAHSVHHSGEDYNFATALRQGALQYMTSWPFYLIPALCFHPMLFVMHSGLNTLGQFWIHTTVIGHLGPLEYILNTPSHHRMHHRPPGNCNYAGILIIWDKMFGTFVGEKEQQDYYGLAKQYSTFDPVWANVEHIHRQINVVNSRNQRNKKSKTCCDNIVICYLKQFLKKRVHHDLLYFRPNNVFDKIENNISLWKLPQNGPKRNRLESTFSTPLLTMYIVVQFFLNLILSILVLIYSKKEFFSEFERIVSCLILLITFSILGRLLDGTNHSIIMESGRQILVCSCWIFGSRIEPFQVFGSKLEDLGVVESLGMSVKEIGALVCVGMGLFWFVVLCGIYWSKNATMTKDKKK